MKEACIIKYLHIPDILNKKEVYVKDTQKFLLAV